ncbi:MAG: sulfur carrier protein ThiS [Chloroflexota bacterium]|nr:sulfur carrier protein ThiS [Chloroflexota bacterium]
MVETMQLTVNGKGRQLDGPLTLLGLLERLGVDPRIVAVEHNGEIVKRDRYAETSLADGDRLEVVRMVGGG